MTTKDLQTAIEDAYGMLWLVVTDDARLHAARTRLLSKIDRDGQRRGIQVAKNMFGAPTMSEIMRIEAPPAEQMITIDGREYRKFIRYPEEVIDGTLRCICCGQIDEEEYHDYDLCVAAFDPPAPSAHVKGSERECFGILNPFGDIWTTNTFDSENAALNHLHRFWQSVPGVDTAGYRVVRVMAKVSYRGEIDRAAVSEGSKL